MPARKPTYRGASASRLSATQEKPVTASSPVLTASHNEHACLDYHDSHSEYDDVPGSSSSLITLVKAALLD